MQENSSFRDILFMHLSQKSHKPEAKTRPFDPTLHEMNLNLHKQFHFLPLENRGIYQSKALPKEEPRPIKQEKIPEIEKWLTADSLTTEQQNAWVAFEQLAVFPVTLPMLESDYKLAYRKTVKTLHPDLGGDSTTFAQFIEASKCLNTAFVCIEESLNSAA